MRKLFFLIFLVACIFLSAQVSAVTISGVSGEIAHGQSVTLTGSNFGSNNLNIKWLGGNSGVIESGTNGSSPSNTDGWVFNNGAGYNPVVSTMHYHSGTKSLYHHTDSSHYNSALRLDLGNDIQPGGHFYATWWVRFSYSSGGQWKMFRVNYQNDITDDAPQYVMFNWTTQAKELIIRPGPGVSDNTVNDWSPPFPALTDRWYRVETDVKISDVGTSNGSYTTTLYDPTSGAVVTSKSDTAMSYYNSSKLYRWAIWQNYTGNGMTGFEAWTDDYFVQTTPARIELCDTNGWGDRTHCEIQRPTSWSDSVINFTLNQGSFSSSQTVYLYVIDSNGDISNGYPVTLGSSGSSNPSISGCTISGATIQ